MSANSGGPAFPTYQVDRVYAHEADRIGHMASIPVGGMSLRDYFAGQVLAGYAADHKLEGTYTQIAEWCYVQADAMIAERAK